MGFLKQFLQYKHICIQCHNNPDPDTLGASLGLYKYFTEHGIDVKIIYGGTNKIKKRSVLYMIDVCNIPIQYAQDVPKDTEILILVDGQYGQGNVQCFNAPLLGVIDHHMPVMDKNERTFIDNSYQSCSTIVWRMLTQEGYNVKDNYKLCIALLYGLYTDTASYGDLFKQYDVEMRNTLNGDYPELEKLKKSCMTMAELMIAGDAIHNIYVDTEYKFALIPAIHCEQSVLGIIGDMAIQVDIINLCVTYTDVVNAYQISIRSCDRSVLANEAAIFICDGLGNGGGHIDKAGGRISQEMVKKLYGDKDIHDVILERIEQFIKKQNI